MSTDPTTTPDWARAGQLQIDMLGAVAEAERKYAAARRDDSRTANNDAATALAIQATANANAVIKKAAQREWQIEQDIALAEKHGAYLGMLKTGRRLQFPASSVYLCWAAFDWCTGKASAVALRDAYSRVMPVLMREDVQFASEKIGAKDLFIFQGESLGVQLLWMRDHGALPVTGSPVHLAMLDLIAAVESTVAEKIAQLEAWRDKVHALEHADLEPLRQLLQIAIIGDKS